jgi:hypothetical protein
MALSHRGRRRRALIVPVLGHDDYFLHKLESVKRVQPRKSDRNRGPFLVDFVVRRKLKSGGWGKELKMSPHASGRGQKKRWDLVVCLRSCKTVYVHRILGLSVCPVTTDRKGKEIEPFFATVSNMHLFEVHHGHDEVSGTHDLRHDCLFPLYKEYHRTLSRPRRQ